MKTQEHNVDRYKTEIQQIKDMNQKLNLYLDLELNVFYVFRLMEESNYWKQQTEKIQVFLLKKTNVKNNVFSILRNKLYKQ